MLILQQDYSEARKSNRHAAVYADREHSAALWREFVSADDVMDTVDSGIESVASSNTQQRRPVSSLFFQHFLEAQSERRGRTHF